MISANNVISLLVILFVQILAAECTTKYKTATSKEESPTLVLKNDSPTILGASTTFYAALILPDGHVVEEDNYLYMWKEDIPRKKRKWQHANVYTNLTEKYNDRRYDIGSHKMKVDVFKYAGKVASADTSFEITEYINGGLAAVQKNVSSSKPRSFATNQEIEFIAEIYDPSQYFRDANLSFTWDFGNRISKNTTQKHTVHSYGEAAIYKVKVNLTALVPYQDYGSFDVKTGQFEQTIRLMDPITDFTINGRSEVTLGQRSNYTLTCNGSLPIMLCWYFRADSGCEISLNESVSDVCQEITLLDDCRYDVELDFNTTGQHCFGIRAYSDISEDVTLLDISVKDVPAPPSPAVTVSLTSLAVLTTLGGIIVAAFAFHQIVRARRLQPVEVADFDFRERTNSNTTYRSNLPSVVCFSAPTEKVKRPLKRSLC
ncbi:transmembrane protein 130-like [Ptychodera flava]|uniref:transmembrane protein 130-like n=1 Tax=Ptychodera flava TaxID=63121 RepID=UPI00396A357F